MLKIGDKVSVINEATEGTVILIKSKEITIETTDGFHQTYKKSELVLKPSDEIDRLLKMDIRIDKGNTQKKKAKGKAKSVVDLHYSGSFVLPKDILSYQLIQFKTEINLAIKANQQEITFIHGKGAGVLRTEIEKILRKNDLSHTEGSFSKYGVNGAIVVHLLGIKNFVK